MSKTSETQLGRLEKRLVARRLTLDVDRMARELLVKEGYGPQFGGAATEVAQVSNLLYRRFPIGRRAKIR
ncbi:MAG: hypothetical protein HYY24_15045 [Verrucomicrobia bacterium]|nr:hypothetical protein [Verrucomicrobiota bacterium]